MTAIGDTIFCRDENLSDSEEASSDDLWDDTLLVNVYDKAINVAHEEVAKRLAMDTNSSQDATHANTNSKKSKNKNSSQSKCKTWKIGSQCRAIYSEDGLEYEATITYIDGHDCIVTFLGYENEEETKLINLKPSLGEKRRRQQIQDANGEVMVSESNVSDSVASNYSGYSKAGKNKKTKKASKSVNKIGMCLPSLPQLPSFSPNLMNIDNNMPLPPPPLLPPLTGNSPEDQALSSMLISWYMSGYYTGLYQGQKNAKRNAKFY